MRPQSFRFFFFVVLTFMGTALSLQASASMVPRAPQIDARGYLLMDAASGHIIVEHNAEQRLPPASLTKMMTAYIAEAELQKGNLSEDDMAPISVKAWKMGGSRMFVKEGTRVSVGDLLKGIIIQSGNDASVAMAEYIAGSEDAFADLMNQHARRLGMNQSHFMNATGWPAENHFTTARDMAILARAIVRDFPEHYDIYAEKEFTYNGITQQNRNLLLWRDESVDGLKTGHTEEAGYCLVSSAKKDGMRLIAVVMGTDSEGARARESQKLLTYGFRFFETYKAYSAGDILDTAELWMGDKDQVRLGLAEDLVLTIPRESHENLKAEVTVNPQLQAPINEGEKYGTVTVRMNNELLVEKPLVALESVEEAGLFTRLWHHILLFFKGLF
ncbi:MAG: serine-type D-Ala-D-Ala carboxypeptidase [Alcanivoracaceae bacterium]|uniref:D-alanyl-D-alanine carboxypeptidase family protein n=1 Tax=Alcanivorax sp. MD8A TaxID=1177157 RepID=UPI000C5DE288|nr:D-alanyl-D-alanine carboxypeptidase family protein [Alcanivorax sp. MD8A]MAX55693.1 serine-type D-Ala-D-Ala carboxypeptidase [Alcanivoracaceae bacterium]MEE2869709.1 D-alanyl-D-alanine carboxypeptidase family protein [Pseudomonadota bacterium]PNE03713.1 D-alanyl-D-alanine-carboxypeptidase [Alcanivorax sp. MD8A]|tara:strand:- start:1195 stop:2355 length:1161 start_codon:yes stop_codon:yes gene_type:complete